MSTIAWVVLALAAPPSEAVPASLYQAEARSEVSASQIADSPYAYWAAKVRDALRNDARSTDQKRILAFESLLALSAQLSEAASISESQRAFLRDKLNRRITRAAAEIQRDVRTRALRLQRFQTRAAPASILDQLANDRAVLAQFQQLIGGQAAGPVGDAGNKQNLDELIERIIDPQAWEPNGGAGLMALFQRGGGGAQAGDGRAGEGLIELIQRVIEPDSWEENGGPGTIVLFGQ